jgi:putative Holliday junction resolvase
MGRFLGIDLGTKRIGLALSDSLGMIASPYQIIESVNGKTDVQAIQQIGIAEEVEAYIIGMPLRLDGGRSGMGDRVEQFAKLLESLVQKPVHRFDERWTTAIAERSLRESNLSRKSRKEHRDAVAAAILLQGWLDIQRRREASEDE